MFSVVVLPDTHVTWPHPAFWRMVLGLSFLYALYLIYLTFLPIEEAWKLMIHYDPKLGKDMPEKNYGEDCRFFTPEHPYLFKNFLDAAYDIHFVAHFLGWWFKVLIIWDAKICWICSIMFEVLEITFRHWLPNFYECWWDHVSSLDLANSWLVWVQFLRNSMRSLHLETIFSKETWLDIHKR